MKKMIDEFKDWFIYDFLWDLEDGIADMSVKLFKALLIGLKYMLISVAIIVTCPIWLIPFVYWYFREWRTNNESED